MSDLGTAAVRASVQSTPNAFNAEDFEPRPLSSASAKSRTKRAASVFISGSDWASASSTAILDAFHERVATEAANSDEAKSQLSFMRNAGSMMLDGDDADLVEAENVRGKGPRTSNRFHVVECRHCCRVVLASRFLRHLAVCPKFAGNKSIGTGTSGANSRRDGDGDAPELDDVDAELSLVIAPYNAAHHTRNPRMQTGNPELLAPVYVRESPIVDVVTLPYFTGTTAQLGGMKKKGLHWQKRLTPLGPVRRARGGQLRRLQKVALMPLSELQAPKKKQSTAEKRALTAAGSVGLGSMDENDCLEFAGGEWGLGAQWAKLIQMCRPIVVPRSELRKNVQTRESPLSLFVKAPGGGSQFLQAESVDSKMAPRHNNTRVTKAVTKHLPSLPGALLHVRGKHFKKLMNSVLARMDTSSSSIPKAIYMYHGQSFFANPGQFFSDHRSPSEVTLPSSVNDPMAALVAVRPAPPTRLTPQQAQALAAQRASAGSSASPATPHEPPTKKQRVSKPQPRAMQAHVAQPNAAVPPKQPMPMQRKMPQQRAVPNAAAIAKQNQMAAARLSQQRQAIAMNMATNSAAVASAMKQQQRVQAQPAQAKRQYRQAAPIPPSAISTAALNAQMGANKVATPVAAPAKSAAARNVARSRANMPTNAQAQKLMNHAAAGSMLNPFQQSVAAAPLGNRTDPSMNARNNPGNLFAEYESMMRIRNGGSPAGMPQSGINYQNELAQVISRQKKQVASRGMQAVAARAQQHRPNLNIRDLERQSHAQAQAQLVQLGNPAQQAQMRAYPHVSQAALRRFSNSQVRQANALQSAAMQSAAMQTTAALNARAAAVNTPGAAAVAAQMFANQQMGAGMGGVQNLYNAGFSVPVPQSHDRAAHSMPMQGGNPASLTLLQMLQSNPAAAGNMATQLANAGVGRAGAMAGLQELRAIQGFGPGMGVPGNILNYYQAAAAGAADSQLNQHQNLAAIAAKRMANRNAIVPGMMPNDALLSQLLPGAQHGNIMHGVQPNAMGAAGPHLLAGAPQVNGPTSTSQALSDIDKALSLGGGKE